MHFEGGKNETLKLLDTVLESGIIAVRRLLSLKNPRLLGPEGDGVQS